MNRQLISDRQRRPVSRTPARRSGLRGWTCWLIGLLLGATPDAVPGRLAELAQVFACEVPEGNAVRYRYLLVNRDDEPIGGMIIGYDNTHGAGYPNHGILQLRGHPVGLDIDSARFPESSFSGPAGWHAQWYSDGEPEPFAVVVSRWDRDDRQAGTAIPPGGTFRFSLLVERADPGYLSGRILIRPTISRSALQPVPYSVPVDADSSACQGS